MNIFFAIIIFCITLFLYLHIYYQLKTSNDLEIYEIENPSKEKLEEICDIRQPVLFNFINERINHNLKLDSVIKYYSAFDIQIRDVKNNNKDEELYIPLLLKTSQTLFNNDKESKYISEKNHDFLEETGLKKAYQYNDDFLRPFLVSNCKYDLLLGSNNSVSPFKYNLNYRNFFMVTQGEVTIKLAPPKSSRYLYTSKDYENFEFSSPINPWDVQHQYKADFDKVKCLEIKLKPGFIFYIPAYWWYSIKFNNNTSIAAFYYKSYMNNIAILPELCMHFLQSTNVKRNSYKRVSEGQGKEPTVSQHQHNGESGSPDISLKKNEKSENNIKSNSIKSNNIKSNNIKSNYIVNDKTN